MIIDEGMVSLCTKGCYCMTKTKLSKGKKVCAKCGADKEQITKKE